MTIQQPQLVLCRAGTPSMLKVGGSYLDDGVIYEMVARFRPFAPAGESGEAIMRALFLTTTHFAANVSLYVTPYVDFVALATQRLDLVGAANTENITTEHELFLSIPMMVGGVEKGRVCPRGRWIDVKIETKIGTLLGSSARQIVDGCTIEYDEVTESLVAIP
jgi:hypothetical protein